MNSIIFEVGTKVLYLARVHTVVSYDSTVGYYRLLAASGNIVEIEPLHVEAYRELTDVEKLKAQAADLIDQANRKEREEREQARREERKRRTVELTAVLQNAGTQLAEAITAANIRCKFVLLDDEEQKTIRSYFEIEPHINIDLNVCTNRFNQDKISGVSVKIGNYGERPQTYATSDSNLIFDKDILKKIVTSVVRRVEAKTAALARRQTEQAAYEKRKGIAESNRPEAERLQKLVKTSALLYVRPSEQEEGSVVVELKSIRTLTPAKAEELINKINQLLK